MSKPKTNKYVSYRIPNIDILCVSNKKKAKNLGKYIIKLDDKWQYASNDITEGFKEYISNPLDTQKNGISKDQKATKSLNLLKSDYNFDGIIDYSLDLRHLINYCDDKRLMKTYFKSFKKENLCFALVKINFAKNTKDMREFLYRQDGFTITYCIDGKEQQINYIRYKRTASGAREGSCLFIAKDLYEPMMTWSSAGIDANSAKFIDPVSWEAYIALTLSSIEETIELKPEQILFVKDQEVPLNNDKVFEIYSEDGRLMPRPNRYSGIENNKNNIWDGEGLIDSALFEENETLKEKYANKSMLLLRGKLFKACVFRTHIQDWFRDNGISDATHKVSDLNGYTKAKKISDIRFIIPYSCLKFLKFTQKNEQNKDEDNTTIAAIKNWLTNISGRNTRSLFGIIKADKPSKLINGSMVFTTYQMLNTLGFDESAAKEFLQPTINMMTKLSTPGKEGADYVKDYLDNIYFDNTTKYDYYGEEVKDDCDTFKIIHYEEMVAGKLLTLNSNYHETPHYKHIVKSLLEHIKNQVTEGRVLVNGVYGTLFCNGIELLKYAIDKDYHPDAGCVIRLPIDGSLRDIPVLTGRQIYSKKFDDNEQLVCARNPHITMGNYYLATNTKCMLNPNDTVTVYDTYFDLSNEIVCVNAIDSDIMNILNGCDFDSDTMLITNNPTMLKLLRNQLAYDETANKFRPPFGSFNPIQIKANDKEIANGKVVESLFLSRIDDKLSNNMIGEIVNLSQRLNSLIWMLAPLNTHREKYYNWNRWTSVLGKNLYEKGCCTLAVLSNIEIDNAKRTYDCNTKAEVNRIRAMLKNEYKTLKEYTAWLDKKSKYTTPIIKPEDTLMGHKILGLDPMGYIIKVISSAEDSIRKTIPNKTISDYQFISEMLNQCGILQSDSNCEESLNTCLNALIICYDHLDAQNIAGKNNKYYKRNYAKDCTQIINCSNTINNVLNSKKVNTDALLWQLIKLLDDNTKLLIISGKNNKENDEKNNIENYEIVNKNTVKYQIAAIENRTHKKPKALLWASLFLGYLGDNKASYLSQKMKFENFL